MAYKDMKGLERALNRPKSDLANQEAYSLIENLNDDNLREILSHVNSENPEWWEWTGRTLEQEVELLLNGIRENKKDKGIQTTISSIGYALMCNNGDIKVKDALIKIHDEWEAITSYYDSSERLARQDRVDQYVNYDDLTEADKVKDMIWIEAVKKVLGEGKNGGGLRRKSTRRKSIRRKSIKRKSTIRKATKRKSMKRKNTIRRRR